MLRNSILSTTLVLALGTFTFATTPTMTVADPISDAVSGKTLTHSKNKLKLRKNGKLTGNLSDGSKLSGAWTVRDGQFCRTLKKPERLAGTECQEAVLGDGVITITGRTGPLDWIIN